MSFGFGVLWRPMVLSELPFAISVQRHGTL